MHGEHGEHGGLHAAAARRTLANISSQSLGFGPVLQAASRAFVPPMSPASTTGRVTCQQRIAKPVGERPTP
jgi:hypothetical protein